MKAPAFLITFPEPLRILLNNGIIKLFSTVLIFFLFSSPSFSQSDTSTAPKHSPKKAAIMSACLPGLGQIYNKKYWKLPVIYVGAAAVTYFAVANSHYYNEYKDAYIFSTDGDSTTVSPFDYSPDGLLTIKNYYRRNLEITYIVAFGIYVLNIIDASVDAHLFDFNVNDDLTLNISPVIFCSSGNYSPGLSFSFNIVHFKTKTLR
ncbi:MAG: DUF5683 domain-containing protein [Bacteroidota bacterium]